MFYFSTVTERNISFAIKRPKRLFFPRMAKTPILPSTVGRLCAEMSRCVLSREWAIFFFSIFLRYLLKNLIKKVTKLKAGSRFPFVA